MGIDEMIQWLLRYQARRRLEEEAVLAQARGRFRVASWESLERARRRPALALALCLSPIYGSLICITDEWGPN